MLTLHDTPLDAEALLERARLGDVEAADRLVAVLYAELRRMAGRLMRGQRNGHTLQATGLVHEAIVKLQNAPGRRAVLAAQGPGLPFSVTVRPPHTSWMSPTL